jgi:hypothetical protein
MFANRLNLLSSPRLGVFLIFILSARLSIVNEFTSPGEIMEVEVGRWKEEEMKKKVN